MLQLFILQCANSCATVSQQHSLLFEAPGTVNSTTKHAPGTSASSSVPQCATQCSALECAGVSTQCAGVSTVDCARVGTSTSISRLLSRRLR